MELTIAVLASLISVVNPLGAVPVFLAMTPQQSSRERNHIAFHTSVYFILILLSFFMGGAYILSFFGISVNAIRIAGGLIILSSGFSLLNGHFAESRSINSKVQKEALTKPDISFSPLAMPLLSGPGSISLLISLWAEYPDSGNRLLIAFVVVATGLLVYLILRISPMLNRAFGVSGLKAISRIMGFIVMSIGIQYIISGIVNLVGNLA